MPVFNELENPDAPTLKQALDAKRASFAEMPESEIYRTPKLDASAAAGIVIGSLPRIMKYREAVELALGETFVGLFDDLPVLAYATRQANIELAAADAMSDLSAMEEALRQDHMLILTDAEALANRGLIERTRLDAGRGTHGYRTLIGSTHILVSVLREHWPAISGKTPLTLEDLDRAERRAQQMEQRLDEREQGSTRMPALETRTRALSALIRGYGEVRRAITFVRWWHDDADTIAPSLWSGRKRTRETEVAEPNAPPVVDVTDPVAPVPVPSGPTNGGGPFTPE